MSDQQRYTRREALGVSTLLPMTAALGLSTVRAKAQSESGPELVVFYTRTGNTRVIANQIRRARSADLFEIQTGDAYPEDYEETVAQATREREASFAPPLVATVPQMESYRTVFLGFPIWGMDAPSPVRSFLSTHDLSEKNLVPFITHGGYGLGQSMATIEANAPGVRLREGFSMECDQERRTLERVTGWLENVPA